MSLEDYGMLTEPMPQDAVEYDLRALLAYCRQKEIEPKTLSSEELKQFEIPKV